MGCVASGSTERRTWKANLWTTAELVIFMESQFPLLRSGGQSSAGPAPGCHSCALRLPSCTRATPGAGRARGRHSRGFRESSLPRLRGHGASRRRSPALLVECWAGFWEKTASS
ncbi:hypothetical protein MJT46_003393 [Ovis ammon polii x Ovis aries]|nr:hypothetical protein MJT46_003393 [Ovis ammon polii x Ovis aries]